MIEIMDTTLRDGEQTSGVSFAAHEKLSKAQVLLSDLGVTRVEIASARVSDGEFEAVKRVAAWAARSGNLDKLEVLGFVDGTVSLDWIESAGCRVVNLLCKGSYKHVTAQLRKTPEQHVDDIRTVVLEAAKRKVVRLLAFARLRILGKRCVERTSDLPFHAPGYLGSRESRKYLRVLQDDGGPVP